MTSIRISCLGFLLMAIMLNLEAQWDVYQATWEGQPGEVLINMDWKRFAPLKNLPYLLVIETANDSCDHNGFAPQVEIEQKIALFDAIDSLISLYTYIESVGMFSHGCKIRSYSYMKDTVGLNSIISKYGLEQGYEYELIKDADWHGYLEFLFPDAFLIQTMINQKVIGQLQEAGEDIKVKRLLRHTAAFSSKENRRDFKRVVRERGFKTVDERHMPEDVLPYELIFERKDHLKTLWISEITLELSQAADKYFGFYSGWEVELD